MTNRTIEPQDWKNLSLKRPNYFPGQYLLAEDFQLAHEYLSDRQRYINSRLHLAGIVEGLEVEAIAGKSAVTVKSGKAIDGEGYLIILPEERKFDIIESPRWVCLRYHEERVEKQQDPDGFTRFVEEPLLTIEAKDAKDAKTITLAKLTLENKQVRIDNSVRQYSGVRLPSGENEEISLSSDGNKSLAIKGDLSISGKLKLGSSEIISVSETIDKDSDRSDVVPSEKAIKQYIDRRIKEEKPAIPFTEQGGKPYDGWKTEGGAPPDSSSVIQLISYREGERKSRLTIQRNTGNVGIGTTTPERTLDVEGTIRAKNIESTSVIRAKHIESTNPMRHRMYPNGAKVYQDISQAVKEKMIQPSDPQPTNYNKIIPNSNANLWKNRQTICFGEQETGDKGALVNIPSGYDTVWVRVPGEFVDQKLRYNIHAKYPKEKLDLGYWTGGPRYGNSYCPDGSLTDGNGFSHVWLPIPVGRDGQLLLIDEKNLNPERLTVGLWFSGLGFSKNPWAHATQSGLGYHWTVNGGTEASRFGKNEQGQAGETWNGDILFFLPGGKNVELMVPYVVSPGRDKLLYLIQNNHNWNGCMHSGITVNDQPIERFLATYDNPFARHWNSKFYNRYIAARIPFDFIPQPKSGAIGYLKVIIDMRNQEDNLLFREIGTHDLEVPDYSE